MSQETIQRLIDQLAVKDGPQRKAVMEELRQIGEEAVPALIEVLGMDDTGLRWLAAETLGQIGDARAVPALRAALQDEQWWVRASAARALGGFKAAEAIPDLVRLFDDGVFEVEEAVVFALRRYDSEEMLALLKEQLASPHAGIRFSAAQAVARFRRPELLPDLLELFADTEVVSFLRRPQQGTVAGSAAVGVANNYGASAIDHLLPLLGKETPPTVRYYAVKTLGFIRDKRPVSALITVLHHDRDYDVRNAAAIALGWIGDPAAVPSLASLLKGSSDLAYSASEALEAIGTDEAKAAIRHWVDHWL